MNIQASVLASLLCVATTVHGETTDGSFEARIKKDVGLRYRTVTPADFDPTQEYPLILFLHGRGEQGDNLDRVQIHGPFKKVAELGLPVIIVAPQSPKDEWWDVDALDALVDHLLWKLPIDKNRVYLTGLSMGGHGTWLLAARRPETFAAIAPICGYSLPSKAKLLRHVPIWIFHGAKDSTIHVRESTAMAQALNAVGNDARLTIYPDVGHNAWTATYDDPQFYEWMLSHSTRSRSRRRAR